MSGTKRITSRIILIVFVAVLFVSLFPLQAYAIEVGYNYSSTPDFRNRNSLLYPDTQGSTYDAAVYAAAIMPYGTDKRWYTSPNPFTLDLISGKYYIQGTSVTEWYLSSGKWRLNWTLNISGSLSYGTTQPPVMWSNITIGDYVVTPPPINIDDLTVIPPQTLPWYITYEDEDGEIWHQEFQNKPSFFWGVGTDWTEKEGNVTWSGSGHSKTLLYIDDDWDTYASTGATEYYTDHGTTWKKIHRHNFHMSYPAGQWASTEYEGWDETDDIVLRRVFPANVPYITINNKIVLYYDYEIKHSTLTSVNIKNLDVWVTGSTFKEIFDVKTGNRLAMTIGTGFMTEKSIGRLRLEVDLPLAQEYNLMVHVRMKAVKVLGVEVEAEKYKTVACAVERKAKEDTTGDGRDDDTGEYGDPSIDFKDQYDGYGTPDSWQDYPDTSEGLLAQILHWVSAPIRALEASYKFIMDIIDNTWEWTSGFALFLGRIFAWLPADMSNLVVTAFIAVTIFVIIKAVRGH